MGYQYTTFRSRLGSHMKKHLKVPVYVRADDVRMLERQVLHTDPAGWVRGLVRHALDKMREKEEAK